MFDIIVNGQIVATVVDGIVKLVMGALLNNLPLEVSMSCQRHLEPEVKSSKEKQAN